MIETDCNSILNSKLNFFNIYNLDNNITTYFSAKYYSDNKNKESIDIPQDVSILFLDIEVYQKNKSIPFRFNESNHPISAISLNFDKEYHCFFLHDKLENLNIWESEFKKDLISGKYIDEDENIHINTYMSEERLIIDAWNKIRNLNPFILSGFNADNFDFPYIYRRLMKLYNNDKSSVDKIISVFEIAELRQNQLLEIPEFTICDILHLYKPREDGGLNFGKKQPSYTLDFVSTAELKLKKFDYKDDNADLNEFYEKNPKQYLFYNLIDVVLCNKLNKKLKHIDLHNSIRRTLKNSFTKSLIGNSTSFDSYVLYENLNLNKYIRFGMATETSKSINKEELLIYPKMVDKKKIIDPNDIDSDEYIDLVSKFKGAHVNDPTPRIIKDGSLIIDLDASLPPWEKILIKRNNSVHYGDISNYEFKEGDETLTWTNNNEAVWRKVKGKIIHNWANENGKLILITTETGKQVTVTDNHSIFGIQKNVKCSIPYIIKGRDLKIGDYVVGMKKFEPGGSKITKCPELIGFWLSDGWCHSGTNGSYYIAKQDKSELEKYSTYFKNIRIKNHFSGNKKNEWMATVAEPYRTELKDFYIHSKRKKFIEILKYSLKDRIKIWEGMFDADGFEKISNNQKNPTEILSKYREPEILECFIVAHTIGWNARKFKNGIMNLHRYGPNLVIEEVFKSEKGYASILSKNSISNNNRHPIPKLEKLLPYIKNAYSDEVGLEKIVSIEEIDYEGKVYDISVDETERFFAGSGIGVKNSSLYPSMMLQSNISFDVYRARIIPPVTYKFLNILEQRVGKQLLDKELINSIHDLCIKFVYDEDVTDKIKTKRNLYYLILHLLQKIFKYSKNIENIYNPKTDSDQYLLKFYLIPLLDILSFIHPNSKSYNNFVYDYLFDFNNLKNIYSHVYVLEEPISTKQKILKLSVDDCLNLISSYSTTIVGTCFEKHENKLGLFTNLLTELFSKRHFYQNEMLKNDENYSFYNSRQKLIKTIMNSIYGVLGLRSFRYSNHHLAQSITAQGQLSIKVAQFITENYLKTREIK